jgi:hypothetical protein
MLMPLRGTLGPLGAAIRVAVPFPMVGLVSFWKMNEGSGQAAIDTQGNSNLADNGIIGTAGGVIATARVFTGTQYFQAPHNVTQDFTTKMSLSMWIYPTDITHGQDGWLLAQINYPNISWGLRSNDGGQAGNAVMAFWINDLAVTAWSGADIFIINTWNHFVLVYDGTLIGDANRVKMYVNTVQLPLGFGGHFPATLTPQNIPLNFGSLFPLATQFFLGRVDLMGMWNVALSASQVAALYNSGAGLQP